MVTECCDLLGVAAGGHAGRGRRRYDMQMAVAAGASGWGVAWGAQPEDALRAAGASGVSATVADLEAALDDWLAENHPW